MPNQTIEEQSRGKNSKEPQETHHFVSRQRRRNGSPAIPDRSIRDQHFRSITAELVATLRSTTAEVTADSLNNDDVKSTHPLAQWSIVNANPLIYLDLSSHFDKFHSSKSAPPRGPAGLNYGLQRDTESSCHRFPNARQPATARAGNHAALD